MVSNHLRTRQGVVCGEPPLEFASLGSSIVTLVTSPPPWLSLRNAGPASIALLSVVLGTPTAVAMWAVQRSVDSSFAEAARTLNANRFESFRQVTLSRIPSEMIAGGVLVFLTTMKELPTTPLVGPVGVDTLVTIIWNVHATVYYRYAAVPALTLVVISGLSGIVPLGQEKYDVS